MRLGDIKSESDPLLLGPKEMKAAFDNLSPEDQQVLMNTKVCVLTVGGPAEWLLAPWGFKVVRKSCVHNRLVFVHRTAS